MGWSNKSEIPAALLSLGGIALGWLFIGVVVPIIGEVRQGGTFSLVMILILFVLICGCVIYLLRRRT